MSRSTLTAWREPSWAEYKRATAAIRAVGARLVLLDADRMAGELSQSRARGRDGGAIVELTAGPHGGGAIVGFATD